MVPTIAGDTWRNQPKMDRALAVSSLPVDRLWSVADTQFMETRSGGQPPLRPSRLFGGEQRAVGAADDAVDVFLGAFLQRHADAGANRNAADRHAAGKAQRLDQ